MSSVNLARCPPDPGGVTGDMPGKAQSSSAVERPLWMRGLIRRLTVKATSALLWALEGFDDLEGNVEQLDAELFVAGGFHARPAAGARAEALVVQVGGESGHAVVVGTRDADSLKVAGQGDADGAQIHNSVAIVRVRASGVVEAGTHGGPFVPLATKADLDALADWVSRHVHIGVTPGPTGSMSGIPSVALPSGPMPIAEGTQSLRAR